MTKDIDRDNNSNKDLNRDLDKTTQARPAGKNAPTHGGKGGK